MSGVSFILKNVKKAASHRCRGHLRRRANPLPSPKVREEAHAVGVDMACNTGWEAGKGATVMGPQGPWRGDGRTLNAMEHR